jgi:hypothetical protein
VTSCPLRARLHAPTLEAERVKSEAARALTSDEALRSVLLSGARGSAVN